MDSIKQKLYNLWAHFCYKILKRPILLKSTNDYIIGGAEPNHTVVFLHGIAATSGTWRDTLKELKGNKDLSGIRLISLDLLGFGKSPRADWLDYDYEDYRKSLSKTLKKLKITTPITLIGHSMGSLIAADYVYNLENNIQITNLILVSPPVLLAGELAHLPDRAYAKSYSKLHGLAVSEPAVDVIANFIQKVSSFRSTYLKTPAFAKSMENIILNKYNYHTFTHLKTPTLIIHGRFDPLVLKANLERAAKQNSHIKMASVFGHHDLDSRKRAKITARLKEILKEENV